mmetsp:Transcript_104122/g.301217  ORF Transcript_104122/g.301217 Transcript_104122/m.301217 type:complete len:490 (+) Transcript_104122:86-1555(+)
MMNPETPAVSVPPAVAPPRGLAGIFDDYEPGELLDMSKFSPEQVFLNVYDLGDNDTLRKINAVSTGGNNLLLGGLFHAGVEVFGGEWCYGCTEDDRSGVSCIPPRTHPQHTYRTTVPLGRTRLSKQEVGALTARLAREWRGNQYNLIHKNCQNFCNAMLAELGVRSMPGWVDRAARTASAIDHTSRHAAEQAQRASELVRSATMHVDSTVRNLLQTDDDDVQRLAAEAAENLRIGSQQALGETAKFADAAAMRAQEIAERARIEAEQVGKLVKARTQELFGEDVIDQAAMQAEESVRALGANLWTIGQEVQKVAGFDIGGIFGAVAAPPSSSASSRSASELRCPQGHPLRMFAAKRGTCDGCSCVVEDGARVMDCRECNWYLCGQCCVARAQARGKENRPPEGRAGGANAAPSPAVAPTPSPVAAAPAPAPPMDLLGDIEPLSPQPPAKSEPLDLLGDIVEVPTAPAAPAAPKAPPPMHDLLAAEDDQE